VHDPSVFAENPNVILHNATGLEDGHDENAIAEVANFIENGARQESLWEQIHCIWYCIDITSAAQEIQGFDRRFLDGEFKTGSIPVYIILTNYDHFVEQFTALETRNHLRTMHEINHNILENYERIEANIQFLSRFLDARVACVASAHADDEFNLPQSARRLRIFASTFSALTENRTILLRH